MCLFFCGTKPSLSHRGNPGLRAVLTSDMVFYQANPGRSWCLWFSGLRSLEQRPQVLEIHPHSGEAGEGRAGGACHRY